MESSGYVEELKKDIKSRKGLQRAVLFVLAFLACFIVLLYMVVPLSPGFWEGVGIWHAQTAQSILAVFGLESSVEGNVLTMEVGGEEVGFLISRLCSGDVEIALLVSLLLASFDVLLIWRMVGALAGTAFLLLMNPLRIAVTLMVTKDSGLEAGDFYHTVIFRLFLFVLLVLYYFAWYRVFAGRKSGLQERICERLHV